MWLPLEKSLLLFIPPHPVILLIDYVHAYKYLSFISVVLYVGIVLPKQIKRSAPALRVP